MKENLPAGNTAGIVKNLQDRAGRHALAAAAFADDAEGLAPFHLKGDAIHRADNAVVGEKLGLEIFDLEKKV